MSESIPPVEDMRRAPWQQWCCALTRGYYPASRGPCSREAKVSFGGIDLCWQHLTAVEDAVLDHIREQERQERESTHRRVETPRGAAAERLGVVYYAAMGNNLIKIGATMQLGVRMRALRVDEPLATEPGYKILERKRHLEFEHLHVGLRGELFRPEEALLSHIRRLQKAAV